MVGQKLEETTQVGDSTKRNPPQKDPEISAEKKNKDGDRDSIYDDNAEQQQQQSPEKARWDQTQRPFGAAAAEEEEWKLGGGRGFWLPISKLGGRVFWLPNI